MAAVPVLMRAVVVVLVGPAMPVVLVVLRIAMAAVIVVCMLAVQRGREALRIVLEPVPAARRAEQVGVIAVLHPVRAVRRHGHAADGVDVRHGQMLVRARTAFSSSTTRGSSLPSSRAASATQWSR